MSGTSYGEIYNLHAIVVDRNKEKYSRRTCQKLAIELADMFSAASKSSIDFLLLYSSISFIVDAGKTGYQIDRKRITEIRKIAGFVYPDFLMKQSSYPSQSILGILYRRALQFRNENPKLFEGEDTNVSTNYATQVGVISLEEMILLSILADGKKFSFLCETSYHIKYRFGDYLSRVKDGLWR